MQGLKRLRIARGLTLEKLARVIGVRQSTCSMWENGESFPRRSTLDKLCKFFDCKIDDLI